MDAALRLMYDLEGESVRRREDAARDGVPALEVLAERIAASTGRTLSPRERRTGGRVLQWAVGIGTGVLYARLRDHLPGRGIRRGIGYGAGFSVVVDEGLVPLLGLSPGPSAFPWQTHARGFLGHLVFGAAAEAVLGRLDRVSRPGAPPHRESTTPTEERSR